MITSANLHAGDWVEVRSKEEILATLGKNGRLEGLPFMPEMFEYCGRRIQVFKRAHKTCDPPNGLESRRMPNTVHLEDVRCNGKAHGGCQAACLMYWKEAWLKPVDGPTQQAMVTTIAAKETDTSCTERNVWDATLRPSELPTDEPAYVCQSTEVEVATLPLKWWDVRQYWEDYSSGNNSLGEILSVGFVFVYHRVASSGLGIGLAMRWLFDVVQRMRGGAVYPWRFGMIPRGTKTPVQKLNLQPGELVRVKSYQEILDTLDEENINRGMWFDAEMVPFCGKTFRVLDRVSRIINEKTGKMQVFKNECIILEKVVCNACYAKHRRFCSRAIYPYWREIWLERVQDPQNGDQETHTASIVMTAR